MPPQEVRAKLIEIMSTGKNVLFFTFRHDCILGLRLF